MTWDIAILHIAWIQAAYNRHAQGSIVPLTWESFPTAMGCLSERATFVYIQDYAILLQSSALDPCMKPSAGGVHSIVYSQWSTGHFHQLNGLNIDLVNGGARNPAEVSISNNCRDQQSPIGVP